MKKFIPDANIEDLKIKYTATAFDLAHNKEIVFREGSLYNAIRASISIPTVFTPVIYGDSVLVDGGVVNNIPINNAIRIKNDVLIAVYVNADVPVHHINISERTDFGEANNAKSCIEWDMIALAEVEIFTLKAFVSKLQSDDLKETDIEDKNEVNKR